jgi:hypothetical protein
MLLNACCIVGFGQIITGLFQRATTFIMWMTTGATAPQSTIWNCARVLSTNVCTCFAGWPNREQSSATRNILKRRALLLLGGTARPRVWRFTVNWAEPLGKTALPRMFDASDAAKPLPRGGMRSRPSVPTLVGKLCSIGESSPTLVYALGAVSRLWLTATARPRAVRVCAQIVSEGPSAAAHKT